MTPELHKLLKQNGFQDLRIGISRNSFWNQASQRYRSALAAGLMATFKKMRSPDATIIDQVVLPKAGKRKCSFVGGTARKSNGTIVIYRSKFSSPRPAR